MLSAEETYSEFDSDNSGLSDEQVSRKQKKHGKNEIEGKKQKSLFRLFFEQVNNPIIYLLLGAVVISFVFGDIPEAVAIIIVIILNTLIGFWMEYQAQTSVNALKKLNRLKASVVRNNQTIEIDAVEIVPGDILELEAGDVIPADARVVSFSELKVDESPLTGESLPVEKNNKKLEKETELADRKNMLYKGTAITGGKAKAIVTAIGLDTEIGKISEMAGREDKDDIPLNVKLRKLSHRLIWVTAGLATIFFLIGWIAGKEIYLMLQTAIAWTIAAIPEGLPIVASIALARGMLRLSKRNVIVKKLAAVETLGETTVIFTDKTGTLTENKLSLESIEYPGQKVEAQKTDVLEVVNYVKAMDYGLKRLKELPICLRLMREIHAILMKNVRGQHLTPGEFRRSQNWIGPAGCNLNDAKYVPPPVHEMHEALGNFEKFLHERESLSGLMQCALIHYQFEAIHPFLDGNGRIGRLLITLFLCEREFLHYPMLYLSAFFDKYRDEYYERLLSVSQKGEWEEWIGFFLRAIIVQSKDAAENSKAILGLLENYRGRIQEKRTSIYVTKLLDELFKNPYISIPRAATKVNTSFHTAKAAIEKLKKVNILVEITDKQRGKVYCAKELLNLLEK